MLVSTLVLPLWLGATGVALPQPRGDAPPAQLEAIGAGAVLGASAEDEEACGTCHADAAAQWRTSAHAFASFNNPLYRVAVDGLREDRDPLTSRMCASCHDIALLRSGAMDAQEILPDDRCGHAGVS